MAKEIVIDNKFVKNYFLNKRGVNYLLALDIHYHMSFHADGFFLKLNQKEENSNDVDKQNPYFHRLIDQTRPSESETIKAYRRSVYLPKTKRPYWKVFSSLRKIVKSQDWKIVYENADKLKGSVADGEGLEDYCEKNYPYFESLENWIYNYALNFLLTDPNGLMVVMPTEFEDSSEGEIKENEYLTPYTYLIPSKDVLDFKENAYAVYVADEVCIYHDGKGNEREGKVIRIITPTGIHKASQIDDDKNFKLEVEYTYSFDKMPAWRVGGTIKKLKRGDKLFDSFLAPMLPDLDRAAREVSDLDAEVIQHIYSTLWYYSGQECTQCTGTGVVKKQGGGTIQCQKCGGQGVLAKSPYKDLVVKAPGADEKSFPTPPMGYVEKNVEIVKIQDERIRNHIYDALSSINMEFLANTPLSQSGIAKEVDRDELNNFVYSIAYHLVQNILNPAYKLIAMMRYGLTADEKAIEKMLPNINIPQTFNLLTETILEARLKSITESKTAPEIRKQVQLDFVNKTFADVPQVRDKVITTLTLDPFSEYTPEEKQNLALTKAVRREDIILSFYIASLVERAIHEDKNFLKLDYTKKKAKLMKYVEEIIADMDEESAQPTEDVALKVGAIIQIPAGKEKDPAHAGVNFTVESITGDQVVLKGPDDKIVNGYSITDFQTTPAAEE